MKTKTILFLFFCLISSFSFSQIHKKKIPNKQPVDTLKNWKLKEAKPVYKSPGVYVEEITNPISQIQMQPTSDVGFVGYSKNAVLSQPKEVHSFYEYEQIFGDDSPNEAQEHYLSEAVRLFFLNGGQTANVVSVGNYNSVENAQELINGLSQFDQLLNVSILVVPDALNLNIADQMAVYQAMLQNSKQNLRFSIFDLHISTTVKQAVADFRTGIGTQNLEFGAAYLPSLLVPGNKIPPSGAIAGIYAQMDMTEGVWKAPANISLSGIIGFSEQISNSDTEAFSVDSVSGKSLNSLRTFPGRGHLVWGARTLAGNDNEWRYISVRRLANAVQKSINNGLEQFDGRDNNATTWNFAKQTVTNFLNNLYSNGAFQGSTTRDAFFVKCGLGETMTQNDIDQGRMILEIGIAPIRPAEFIILSFEKQLD